MFRARAERSRFLTTLQPGKKISLSTAKPAGKSVFALMRMVSDVFLGGIWGFLKLAYASID